MASMWVLSDFLVWRTFLQIGQISTLLAVRGYKKGLSPLFSLLMAHSWANPTKESKTSKYLNTQLTGGVRYLQRNRYWLPSLGLWKSHLLLLQSNKGEKGNATYAFLLYTVHTRAPTGLVFGELLLLSHCSGRIKKGQILHLRWDKKKLTFSWVAFISESSR